MLICLFLGLFLLLKPLQSLDSYVVSALPEQFPQYNVVMLTVTNIGSPFVLSLFVLAWAGIELAWQRRDRAFVILLSLLSIPAAYVLKELIHRHRPVSIYADQLNLHSYSFPSGHATMSFVVYLTLAFLISLRVPRIWSHIITHLALILVLLIGVSRIYLGAHYPTDVIGGWIIGSIILLFIRAYVAKRERISQ